MNYLKVVIVLSLPACASSSGFNDDFTTTGPSDTGQITSNTNAQRQPEDGVTVPSTDPTIDADGQQIGQDMTEGQGNASSSSTDPTSLGGSQTGSQPNGNQSGGDNRGQNGGAGGSGEDGGGGLGASAAGMESPTLPVGGNRVDSSSGTDTGEHAGGVDGSPLPATAGYGGGVSGDIAAGAGPDEGPGMIQDDGQPSAAGSEMTIGEDQSAGTTAADEACQSTELSALGGCLGTVEDVECANDDCLGGMCVDGQCVPGTCGDGVVDPVNEDCDDGNNNASDRCRADCSWNQPCEGRALTCGERDAWTPGLREHYMRSIDSCHFVLEAPTDWAQGRSRALALADRLGGTVSLQSVLADLNRSGRNRVTNQTATRLRNHNYQGFVWNDGDMDVSYWMPQGITGSSDAHETGWVENRRLMMVSWYHKTDERPTKGARVSLIDLTEFGDIEYRHLLLAEPYDTLGGIDFEAASYDHGDRDALHAGGIAWIGDLLYVADTRVGFRVYDMSLIIPMSHTNDKDRIGFKNGQSHAHGYKYIVPLVARYRLADTSCPYSFSSVGFDRSTDPPTLLSAEYKSDSIQGRLVHWPVDMATNRLMDINGLIYGRDARASAQTRVQGAVSWEGNYYISSSSQWLPPSLWPRYGRLYRTRPGFGESSISAWVYGCEDLYYEHDSGLIWTPAEFAGFRDVVGIPLRTP